MSALLETLKYRHDAFNGSTTNEDHGTEGKFGIPRFNGDPMMLPEYTYRVKTRMEKEKSMTKEEVDKLGPLGLRLVEGLRGPALRLVQQLDIQTLGSPEGPKKLLEVFHANLKPRKAQEARELYSAGARDGGPLSRQSTESMASYVGRRRAWWAALRSLDDSLKVPETILAEQVLTNSGISYDQQLMVRTMLQGKMTVELVAEELVSQHPQLHERERFNRHVKGGGKGWKSRKPGGFRGFHAEVADDESWEWASQTPTGFTATEDGDWDYNEEELYTGGAGYVSEYDMTEEDDDEAYLVMNFALLTESGFDMTNDEACALAAESLQLENEAYMLRTQGKGKGHGGFGQQRQFDISGQVSFQERKARLAQLKAKTECRRCGMKGHWSGDAACPKGPRRNSNSPKKGSHGSHGSHSGSSKGGSKGKSNKPRVVYFSMANTDSGPKEGYGLMAVEFTGASIPPPSSLTASTPAGTTSRTMATSSSPSSMSLAQAPISMLSSISMDDVQRAQRMRETAKDRVRGLEINAGDLRDLQQAHDTLSSLLVQTDGSAVENAMTALAVMEVDEEGTTALQSEGVLPSQCDILAKVIPNRFDSFGSPGRQAYLDSFLDNVVMEHPSWRLAYNERWWEMVPGHPMFCESDRNMIRQFQELATRGEPQFPQDDKMLALHDNPLPDNPPPPPQVPYQPQPTQLPSSTPPQPASSPPPVPTSTTTGCRHANVTKKGTNKYYAITTCLDCHEVIHREKKDAVASSGTPSTMPTRADPKTCKHPRVTWRGSNGVIWKQTCLDCGASKQGYLNSQPRPQTSPPTTTSTTRTSLGPQVLQVSQMQDVFRTCCVVANVKALENVNQAVTVQDLHLILDAAVTGLAMTTPTTTGATGGYQPPSDAWQRAGQHPKDGKRLTFGEHKNMTYECAFGTLPDYVAWCESSVRPSSCKGMKEFVQYCEEKRVNVAVRDEQFPSRQQPSPEGFMALSEPGEPSENHLIAILDLGCNKTCHGDRWLARFQHAAGIDEIPRFDDEGSGFRGIGGKINTTGTRHLNIGFELKDGNMAVGDLHSVELQDSDAPLLLSINDQRKLGLQVHLTADGDEVFSTVLGASLCVADYNGLLGIRLLPSDLALLGLGSVGSSSETEVPGFGGEVSTEAMDFDASGKECHTGAPCETSTGLMVEDLTGVQEVFLSIENEKKKTMTKGQKKMVDQAVQEVEASDISMWSTLRGRKSLSPLPKGCRVFLMEIFAGAAVLTSMALQMNLSTAAPVDIDLDGSDLLKSSVRMEIEQEIDRQDPYCLTFAPVCGPWGAWSRLNMAKNIDTRMSILDQRDAWYPCLQWMRKIIKSRLSRGRKVLVENPWGSDLWNTLCIDKLIQEAPVDGESGEPLELVRCDQCEYGLVDGQSGLPHLKPTGILTASPSMSLRCSGYHRHQPLEGGQRTRKAQQWPTALCRAILDGFLSDLQERTVLAAFHEAAQEEEQHQMDHDLGTFDFIQEDSDVKRDVELPGRVDEGQILREEAIESYPMAEGQLMEVESERKRKWLRTPKEIRIALRRLHHMTGHGSSASMIQMLRTAGASTVTLEACRHFACETCRKRQPVQKPPVTKMPGKLVFNHEVSGDCFEVQDSVGNRHTIMSIVCLGTLYHQAYWVAPGGVPRSQVCAEALLHGWLQPFGAPQIFTCDRGVHNQGRFRDLLRIHGIQLRFAGVESPFQIGRTERQGGILKDVIKTAVEEQQIIGVQDMKMLVMECAMVKNDRLNHHGFSPSQWVLGKLPRDVTSLTSEEAEAGALGVQEEVLQAEDVFARQLEVLEVRQSAKMAFSKVDSSRRIRAALLRKSVPLRGPYNMGDLVCFYRRGRWHGPARIIGREGRSTLWLVHAGIPIVVSESQLRPATTREVMVKQLLALRPSRRRRRNEEDETPFGQDLRSPMLQGEDEQPSYVELPVDDETPVMDENGGGVTAPLFTPPGLGDVNLDAEPEVPVPGYQPQQQVGGQEEIEVIPVPELAEQPESEQAPSMEGTVPPTPTMDQMRPTSQELTNALRTSVRQLDGLPHRQRSRSPHREPHLLPVPEGRDGLLALKHKDEFYCFLAKRIYKKKRQVGAGREVNYGKSEVAIKGKLDATRTKEWSNWRQFDAVKILPPGEQAQFFEDNPDAEVIPTRWVDTDKSEPGQEPEYKSRLVARGDLEKNNSLRTDSPTTSQLFLNLVMSYSTTSGNRLKGGDISAAFLQGSRIKRKLVLKLPADGIPDQEVEEGSLMVCNKSVYGTKDAPRGFWKQLHDDILDCGLREVPFEQAAYYMPDELGEIAGLMGSHVDDLLWSGNGKMDEAMEKLQKKYNFRTTTSDEFKFCGRIVVQDEKGITINCPAVLDRVKRIYMTPDRRKQRSEQATDAEVSQLRSVVGSLSWYSRVCRPDLAHGVNQLQAVQQKARVDDLMTANRLLSYALETKERGIHYPANAFDFRRCMILSINDASHAASYDVDKNGRPIGHRSQSGRIIALASEDFERDGAGKVHMLSWSSNVIKRVCRSTLQSETMSLQLGNEEAEHLRQALFAMKNLAMGVRATENYIPAMDHMKVMWFTDCRSLSDHLTNPTASEVSDKRLAIDLTALRQELWRMPGELIGNPTYTDSLEDGRTTTCAWISTGTMVADGLTKHMKCPQLELLMETGHLHVEREG